MSGVSTFLKIAAVLLLSTISSVAWAAGACSTYVGKVTLNEYNYIDNFTEIDKLDSSVDLTGWTVKIYTSNRTTTKSLPSTGTSSCFGGQYQVSFFNANEIGTNADAVLFDSSGNVVDILRVRTSLPTSTTYYGTPPSCSFVGTSTDLQVTSGSKGVDRLPDGTGNWRQTPGTGSNSFESQCAANIVGGNADLSITKTVSASTVVRGTAVTFTVKVTNNGAGAASSVVVNDLLPSGFSFSSSSATTGSYSSSTGVWTIGSMANGATATLTITANTTAVATLTNTATVASSTFDPNTSNNSASVSVVVTSPGATLDAVEVGASAGTNIHTKIAGQSFTLDIVSLDASGNVTTSYTKTVAVELVDGTSGNGVCGSMTQLQSVGSYTFTGSGTGKDNGRKTFTFNYPNAWKNVRVRMKDNGSPTAITACSTDNFAVRPASLSVSVTDSNWTTAGTTRTLNGITTAATVTHKAGQPFTVSVTASNASSANTSNYGGSPTATVSACSGTGNACTSSFGTLTLGSWSSSGGTVTASATYNQVGAFGVQFEDTTFADIDLNDSSTSERYVPASTKLDVGRFVPDHFAVSLNTPKFTSACSTGFSYQGQAFSYETTPIITVTAQDASNATTTLYTGTLWRLASSTAVYSALTGTLSATSATATVADSGGGVGTLTFSSPASLSFTRATTSPQSPFAAEIQLAATVSDADGVTYASNPATFGAASSGNGIAFNPGKTMRFGRIKLTNAHGSELATLSVPVEAQYWTGSYWATNTLDSCTGFAASNVNISPAITSLSAAATMTAGKGNLVLAHPSASGTTSLCIDAGPNSAETGAVNCVATTSLGKAFLQGNTNGTLYDDDPRATITFGVYKNANELIYMRENY